MGYAVACQHVGEHFGAGLTASEIDYLMQREWATTAEDILFRRTKAGVRMTDSERAAVDGYLKARAGTT